MNTQTHNISNHSHTQPSRHPRTARGRAMYTLSWFLNGTVAEIDWDQSRLTVQEVRHVNA